MKKYVFSALMTLFFVAPLCAQDTVLANVYYEFKYVRDLAKMDDPYVAKMVLSLGKTTSRYCTESLFNLNDKKAIAAQKKEQERLSNAASSTLIVVTGKPLLRVNKYGAIIEEEITKNFATKKMNIDAVMASNQYTVNSGIPDIAWKIETEKKIINTYNCQKAVGTFSGRIYTVWFTIQLPYSNGPWKLGGLPGLILEATDLKNEVSFLFKEITKGTSEVENTNSFINNQYSSVTSLKDYLKAKTAFEKDPEAIMSALSPNAKLGIKNIDNPADKKVAKMGKYNAIELK